MADDSKTFWDSVRTNKFFKFLKKIFYTILVTWPIGIGLTLWHLIKPDQFDYYITDHIYPDRRKNKK